MNFKLLNEAPGSFRCGGYYPMWRSGSGAGRATICVKVFSDNCSESFEIDMETCVGFEVYKLQTASTSTASYCFVNSSQAPPSFNVRPNISVDLASKELNSTLLFRCNFMPSSEELFYKTIWYIKGEGNVSIHTFEPAAAQWTNNYIRDTTLTEGILMEKGYKAGINISCAVRARYTLSAFSKGGLSDSKFVGVRVEKTRVNLTPGEKRQVQLSLTVPFRCVAGWPENAFCRFDVGILKVDTQEECVSEVVFGQDCGIKFLDTNWSKPSYVTVAGTVTPTYDEKTVTTILKLKTAAKIYHLTAFWWNYDIGHINVNVYKNSSSIMHKECSIRNDPYLYNFNERNHEHSLAEDGVFFLYKNDTDIEVQIKTDRCNPRWPNAFCTCGVAVRAGKTVYKVSHCNTSVWFDDYTTCGDGGDVMNVRTSWNYYQITLPTGTIIDVKIDTQFVNFLNVYIYPTPLDLGIERGLCGVLDNSTNGHLERNYDDLIMRWRVPEEKSMFNPDFSVTKFSSYKPMYQYCICANETTSELTCSPMAATKACKKPNDTQPKEPRACITAKRKKRMAKPKLRRVRRATTENAWQNDWNVTSATAYCEKRFEDSVSVQLVKDVPGVDLNGPMSDCVADIKNSGTTHFTAAAISSVGIKARREALVNPLLSEPDPKNSSAPTLYDVITKQVCPGDCSGRGTCSDGKCRCESGFVGGDCSLNVTTPPQLLYVADDGHCDLTAEDCLETEVLGDVFSGSEDSKCLIKRQMVLSSGKRTSVKKSSPKSIFESISEVFCPLPELSEDEVVVSINISVSHAGDIYSNELSVLVYDSSCVDVDHSTGAWSLQTGFCVYKGRCTSVGSLREDNPCVRCVQEDEGPAWNRLSENGCLDGNTGRSVSAVPFLVTSLVVLNHALLQMF